MNGVSIPTGPRSLNNYQSPGHANNANVVKKEGGVGSDERTSKPSDGPPPGATIEEKTAWELDRIPAIRPTRPAHDDLDKKVCQTYITCVICICQASV
jgi:hypothetical protein